LKISLTATMSLTQAWSVLYENCNSFVLTSIGSYVVLMSAWIIFNLKYTLIAQFDLFSQYKLQKVPHVVHCLPNWTYSRWQQPNLQIPKAVIWKHFRSSLFEQVIITLPLFLIGFVFFKLFGIHAGPELPSWFVPCSLNGGVLQD